MKSGFESILFVPAGSSSVYLARAPTCCEVVVPNNGMMVFRYGHDVIGVARKADMADKKKKHKKKKPMVEPRCDDCGRTRADWENVDMSHTDCACIVGCNLGQIIHVRIETAWSDCEWHWVPICRLRENRYGMCVPSPW